MKTRAVFFDLGGVIVRTEFQAPRQHLAERLGMEYEDLVRLVFESETSRTASIGAISEDEHWLAVARRLKRPNEADALRDEFFAGDVIDRALVDFLERCFPPRSMKPGESIEEAMFHSGKVALVEAIRSAHEIQRSGG